MPTELDRMMDAGLAQVTGEDGLAALGTMERDGLTLPVIASAPPTLPAYLRHYCAAHANTTFRWRARSG